MHVPYACNISNVIYSGAIGHSRSSPLAALNDAARCLEETEEPAEVIVVSVKPPTKNQQ